ncbi:hypothetical protein QYE76_060781 [Lolium multiflorum]|uniref:Uncharacterized protein n=1 Tax=Lolium multiflorum TaxID=4521 RepID=A0AAD8W446_LOLMU|nr:hypothetical protein QYE76_060781 [Lolium multiflorum]
MTPASEGSEGDEGDPVIGRDTEIDRVICILCRRTKNCAVLVGEAGVGKTAIVEGLAQRIASGKVPAKLAGARIVEVDLGGMMAGTNLRGMFERRIKNVISRAEDVDGKVILFIDEMHMLLGAGDRVGGTDAANLLKPALARGRVRCVGATTLKEYSKYIEKDAALERRCQKVHVEEPSVKATIAILQGLKQRYQDHHGLEIQDAAIVAAAQLAGRYITDRRFPDKAIDLIDEACAAARMLVDSGTEATATRTRIDNKQEVIAQSRSIDAVKEGIIDPGHVAQVVSRWTGIPVAAIDQEEKKKLLHLADKLHERVVGQDEAVNLVAQAVLRSRVGLDQPGQPIGSFLFLGSTGVGKTELAKALAEQLFDSEKMLLRFDMSEYAEIGSELLLIGAPPSYLGHEEGGQLTEKVKRRPYSVILFDEVEKAHRSVFNVFLQLLDDGLLTDGKGQTVDFKNTIIIMTSNLGAKHLAGVMAGDNTMQDARGLVMEQVRRRFAPELLNRLSEIVIFEPLSDDKLKQIVKIQMKAVVATVGNKGIFLHVSDAALDVIFSQSYEPMYGARPIRRWLQKNVMTVISEMLVQGEAAEGSTISINASDDKKGLKYEVVKKGENPPGNLSVPILEPLGDSSEDSDELSIVTSATVNVMVPEKTKLAVEMVVSRWTGIPVAAIDREDKEKLLHLAEYSEHGSVMRLIGAPPSYIGYEDGGQLTEKVKKRPYTVILFDEVENAHPSVFNVREHFAPELLNRLIEIAIFDPLSHDILKEIVKMQVKGVVARVANNGISVHASDVALDVILSESYNPKNVMTMICKMLVKGEAEEGSTISIDATDDNKGLKYEVVKKVADPPGNLLVPALEPLGDSNEDKYDMSMITTVVQIMSWLATILKRPSWLLKRFLLGQTTSRGGLGPF